MLREADEKDKLVWVRLNKEFMNFEIQDGDLWNHVDEAKDEELGDVFVKALKKPEHITIFMIESPNGDVIGFANLMTIFSVWAGGFALIIDDLFLAPEHQGRGYGRQVMKEIEDYAREKGYKRLQFQSEETNPAAKLERPSAEIAFTLQRSNTIIRMAGIMVIHPSWNSPFKASM